MKMPIDYITASSQYIAICTGRMHIKVVINYKLQIEMKR